jgi:hypothetical protein
MFGGKTGKNIYCSGSYKKLKEKPFLTTPSQFFEPQKLVLKCSSSNKAKQHNSRYIFKIKVSRKISHCGKIFLKISSSVILPLSFPAHFSFTRRNFRQVDKNCVECR